MKKSAQVWRVFALSLAIILFCTFPAHAQRRVCTESCPANSQESISLQALLRELAKADVVYLGETHDRAHDHATQLRVIQELYQRNGKKVAIGMEMFQRPYQAVVNKYLAGKLTEEELLEKTEYEDRWGFPWENYAPILRFAREKKLAVIALNTPSQVTRKVARQGLESLTAAERKYIPPVAEIRTDNEEYREIAFAAFKHHQAGGHGNSAIASRFFQAQVLWDETMAEAVAQFVKANPGYQVVVLAGQGHIIYGHGIPSRVSRRLQGKRFTQRSVLLSPPKLPANKDKPMADFIWTDEAKKEEWKDNWHHIRLIISSFVVLDLSVIS